MLLSRLPLRIATALDLHVLGLPPAFVLSQDQTLKLTWRSISTNAHITICDLRHNYFDLRGCVYGFRFATERRLRIPFVRLFTMSKNPEPGDNEDARNLAGTRQPLRDTSFAPRLGRPVSKGWA